MPTRARTISRNLAAATFIAAGAMHFAFPKPYRKIVPPVFPAPAVLVAVSGAAEVAGGIGLLVPRLRRAAGWGLVALLVAVFPANVYMATSPGGGSIPRWALWARLPLQGVLIAWVWHAARGPAKSG